MQAARTVRQRLLWWTALVGASADVGIAAGGLLSPASFGRRAAWFALVCVSVALLVRIWRWELPAVPATALLRLPHESGSEGVRASSGAVQRLPARDEESLCGNGLRCLERALGGRVTAAKVLALHVGRTAVEVFWDSVPPDPRSPWRVPGSGWIWWAPSADVFATRGETPPSPVIPALRLGGTRTGSLYLNAESFEVVTIGGESDQGDRLRQYAEDLAKAGGSEVVYVNEHGQVLEAVRAIHRRARLIAQGLAGTPWTSALEARLGGGDGARFAPLVVFISQGVPEPDVADVVDAGGRTSAVTCFVVGEHPGASLELIVDEGKVRVPFLPGVPIELEPLRESSVDDDVESEASSEGHSDSVFNDSGSADEPVLEPGGDLVEDLDTSVMVRVLGPVVLEGTSAPLTGRGAELVAYLACHPEGVSADQIKAALWPVREPRPQTWLNRMSACRQALGVAPDGEYVVPHFDNRLCRLHRDVGTDVAVLERVLGYAGSGKPSELAGLREALRLVRGRPFDAPSGYEWAYQELHVAHAERVVVDAAHRLAGLALEAGDSELALWATDQGLLCARLSELLVQDRMRAYHAAGDADGVERAMRELLASLEADDPSVLRGDTIGLYEELRASSSASVESRG